MTKLMLPRRQFLAGLAAAFAAPAMVRVESLMKLPRPEIIKPRRFVPLFRIGDVITFGDGDFPPLCVDSNSPVIVGIVTAIKTSVGPGGGLLQTLEAEINHAGQRCRVRMRPIDNPWVGRA